MRSQSTNVTDGQTDRQTDHSNSHGNTALCTYIRTSRGKIRKNQHIILIIKFYRPTYSIISRHRWRRFRLLILPSVVCMFVCLSRSCIVLKRQKISTWFLLHTTAPCHSKFLFKFGLHRSTPSSTNFASNWPTPCWFERRERFDSKLRPTG